MSEQKWREVDRYLEETLSVSDDVLEGVLKENATSGLPAIDVSPLQGKFLSMLARLQGAKKVLEIGTLGGYSTIWLARAVAPDGKVITLELEEEHAKVARRNIANAGLERNVEVLVGPALETLAALHKDGVGAFDLVFVDADKTGYADYLHWALELSRKGTAIICDNVVRQGKVADQTSEDERVQGVQRMFRKLEAESRLTATALQTVGSKGWDGFLFAIVTEG